MREKTVRRDGVEVSLTPKLFDLLLALVRNPGRTLEKSELLTEVWGDTFVEEGTLAKSLSRLRGALAPEGADEAFIKTVSRRGYRLVVPVAPGRYGSPSPPLTEDLVGGEPNTSDQEVAGTRGARGRTVAALAVAVVAAASVWWAMRRRRHRRSTPWRYYRFAC